MEFNSSIFSAMLTQWGAEPRTYPIVPDRREAILEAVRTALDQCDAVLLNAGSSAGREDHSAAVIREVGQVLYHGIAMKPGKPAILGYWGKSPFWGSRATRSPASWCSRSCCGPCWRTGTGPPPQGEPCQEAVLSRAVVSGLKYQEFVRVRLGRVGGKLMASPLSRGSGVVSSFMRADGILTVPQGVAVRLLRPAHELENTLVSIGSHDPLLDEAADLLHLADPSLCMSSTHVGSMGGIMAVRRGETHIAGVHLLDEGDGSYNAAFIRRYFPSGGVRLVECVGRTQGLMLPPGNPLGAAAGGAGERGLPGAPGEAGGLPAGHEPGQLGRPGGGQLRRAAGGRGAGDDKAPRGADFPHSGGLSGPGQPGRRVCPAHSFS